MKNGAPMFTGQILAPSPSFLPAPIAATVPRLQSAWALLRRPAVALLLFIAVTLAVYAPVLGGEFIWDDNYLVKGEGLIRSPLFCLEVFRHTLFGGSSNFYRPVQTLTYLWDYAWWGFNPFGYHLTNVLLHAANGFLLYTLLRRILPGLTNTNRVRTAATDRGALILALLWTVHPVHSAAVAYIAGRADSLAMGFCLAAWLLCAAALETKRSPAMRAGLAAGAFGCFLAGLCSKEIAFVWLGLFVGWLFVLPPDAGRSRAAWRSRLFAIAGGGLAVGVSLWLRHLPPPVSMPAPTGTETRWVLALRALGDYGRLMLFPDRLYMERQVFAAPGLTDPADPAFYSSLTVLGALVLAAFAAGAWLPGRGRRLRCAGAGWFLVGFLPISNLIPLNASVAEHWLYLPSIGFLLFLAGVALDVPWTSRLRPSAATAAVLLAATVLGLRTWLRAHDWVDEPTFYQQTMRDGGDSPRMHEGLALAYLHRGDSATAGAILSQLVTGRPMLFAARLNLATIQAREGHLDEARTSFERIAAELETSTDHRAGPSEFGVTVRALDRLEPADDFKWAALRGRLVDRASNRFPSSWDLIRLRSADREKSGDVSGALTLAENFVATHWWHVPSRLEAARLLAVAGHPDAALAAWRQAASYDLHDAEAPSSAAAYCLSQSRPADALAWQQIAVRRQPGSLRQHLLLSRVFASLDRVADADHERTLAKQLSMLDEN